MLKTFFKQISPHLAFFAVLFLFVLLLAKNPFSDRTLIPNFEPFPDTFHYITTPRCWLNGQGWKLCRLGQLELAGIGPSVPPFYSVSLLPFFLIKNDPRTFYLANVIFSLIGFFVLYLLIRKIYFAKIKNSTLPQSAPPTSEPLLSLDWLQSQLLLGLPLLAYVTSYHIYWFPTLAMAENLLLPTFIIGLLVLTLPVSLLSSILAMAIALAFFGIKYSALPLTATYLLIYFIKILYKFRRNKRSLLGISSLFIGMLIIAIIMTNFHWIKTIWNGIINIFINPQPGSYFSTTNVPRNLNFYYRTILGHGSKSLWDFSNFYPIWLGVGALSGYIWAVFKKHELGISASLLVTAQILFMSLFYDFDARYILVAIPAAILGFAYFLFWLQQILHSQKQKNALTAILFLVTLIFCFNIFTRIKSQISLNLRYSETPWEYLAVTNFNQFFTNELTSTTEEKTSNKPILISASAPFLIDFYSNNNYELLPLTPHQEFRSLKDQIWDLSGQSLSSGDYYDYLLLYQSKLEEGREVYITNYGLGNDQKKRADFATIEANFKLEKLFSGCHDLCNIYTVENLPEGITITNSAPTNNVSKN